FGQRGQQDRTVGAEHDARGFDVEEIGHRRPGRLQDGGTALRGRVRPHGGGPGPAESRRHRGRDGIGNPHPGGSVEVYPPVTQRRMQPAHPGDVVCHVGHLRASAFLRNRDSSGRLERVRAVPARRWPPKPGHPPSHTSRVGLWFGTLIALFLLIAPGAIIARISQLSWPVAVAVGPALTYGVVAL